MKTVQGSVRTNKVGSKCSFEFKVEEDCTEAEIEEMAREMMFDKIEWNYEVIEPNGEAE